MVIIKYVDMHSKGFLKTPYNVIYVEVFNCDNISEQQCICIFGYIFGFHPFSIACDCCGYDYKIELVNDIELHHSKCYTQFYTMLNKNILDIIKSISPPIPQYSNYDFTDEFNNIYYAPEKFNSIIEYITF